MSIMMLNERHRTSPSNMKQFCPLVDVCLVRGDNWFLTLQRYLTKLESWYLHSWVQRRLKSYKLNVYYNEGTEELMCRHACIFFVWRFQLMRVHFGRREINHRALRLEKCCIVRRSHILVVLYKSPFIFILMICSSSSLLRRWNPVQPFSV